MAKAKLAATIDAARGHSGSLMFWLSPLGPIIQAKPTPHVNPTRGQKAAQGAWTNMIKAWRNAVDAGNTAAWNAYGAAHPTSTKCGGTASLNGFQYFAKVNRHLASTRYPFRLTPPASATTPGPGTLTLTYSAGPPATFLLEPTSAPSSTQVPIIKAHGPMLAGTLKPGRNLRIIAVLTAGQTTPWDIISYYVVLFGAVLPGQSITVTALYADYTTGAYSATSKVTLVVP